MRAKLSKTNQSVEKIFTIIEIMASAATSMRLQDIALKADIPPSTTLRLLNTLMVHGYVLQQPETAKYALSLKFAKIGTQVSSQLSIHEIARPFLLDLSEKAKESVCIAIEQDLEVLYIDSVDGPDSLLRATMRIGRKAPMHCSGVGKIFLTQFDLKQINKFISKKGLEVYTPFTLNTKEKLLKELEEIKVKGYGIDNEECEIGARCVAAPVKDYTGKVIAAISIVGPSVRMSFEHIEILSPVLIKTANEISAKLAHV